MPGRRWSVGREIVKCGRSDMVSPEVAGSSCPVFPTPFRSEVSQAASSVLPEGLHVDNPANTAEMRHLAYVLRHPHAQHSRPHRLVRKPSTNSHVSDMSFAETSSYVPGAAASILSRKNTPDDSDKLVNLSRRNTPDTRRCSAEQPYNLLAPLLASPIPSQETFAHVPGSARSDDHYRYKTEDAANGDVLSEAEGCEQRSDIQGLKELLFQWIHMLNLILPVALGNWGFQPSIVFFLNLIGLVPLSQLLADATDQVALGLRSAVLGALLNATLGNATEMIVTVTSLRAGLFDLVKSAMLGSILSNLLAVLGLTIVAGGLKHSQMTFVAHEPVFSVSLLLLGSMSFSLPTFFFYSNEVNLGPDDIVSISRSVSVVTGITYAAYVGNQMCIPPDDMDEDSTPTMSMRTALLVLACATYLIGMVSDCLVDSINGLLETTTISSQFVGVILLPLAGNVQGALQGVALARNGGTNIAIALALSGCTQVALLVLPFAVTAGWILGKPMDLKFDIMEVIVLILSVLVAFSIVVYGKAGWLHGFVLCTTYCTLAILFWNQRL